MGKKISIIVPIYNTEMYLARCINSLITQDYQNIEIILVNDGSTDESIAICEQYQKVDSRIIMIDKKHTGVGDTRNVGISRATGDYIGFVDSDDYIDKDMFSCLIIGTEKYHAEIAMCDLKETTQENFQKSHDNIDYIEMNKQQALEQLLYDKNIGNYMTVRLFKSTLFNDIKFPFGKLYEDIHIAYKLFCKATKLVYIPIPMYHYFQRPQSIVNNITRYSIQQYLYAIFERYYHLKEQYKNLNLYNVYSIVNVVIKMSIWSIKIHDYDLYDNEIYHYFHKVEEELFLIDETALIKLLNVTEREYWNLLRKNKDLLRKTIEKRFTC